MSGLPPGDTSRQMSPLISDQVWYSCSTTPFRLMMMCGWWTCSGASPSVEIKPTISREGYRLKKAQRSSKLNRILLIVFLLGRWVLMKRTRLFKATGRRADLFRPQPPAPGKQTDSALFYTYTFDCWNQILIHIFDVNHYIRWHHA